MLTTTYCEVTAELLYRLDTHELPSALVSAINSLVQAHADVVVTLMTNGLADAAAAEFAGVVHGWLTAQNLIPE